MSDLFDSSIIIDAANGLPDALRLVDNAPASSPVTIHAVTVAEVLVGTRNAGELMRLKRLLRRFPVEYPDLLDWQTALDYVGRLHLSHDVDLPDCLIAATALRLRCAVVTLNDRHFRLFKGLKVIRPY